MAKIDVESAYRLLPVHPQDRPLQAIRWENCTYVDLVLPFGLRSAAKTFNTVADALAWHLTRAGVEFINYYLDDFIIMGARSDLAWWQEFISQWNGVSFLHLPPCLPQLEVFSDASGSWGCGAWYHEHWFQVQWGPLSQPLSITEKELIPIILAYDTWGREWQGKRILCHCDNQAVVPCLRSRRTSKQEELMHLLRCLVFVEAQLHLHLHPVYIDTRSNHQADDLSPQWRTLFSCEGSQSRPLPIQGVPPQAPAGPVSRLDISHLAPSVWRYFQAGLAPSCITCVHLASLLFILHHLCSSCITSVHLASLVFILHHLCSSCITSVHQPGLQP